VLYDLEKAEDPTTGIENGNRMAGVFNKLHRQLDRLFGVREIVHDHGKLGLVSDPSETSASWLRNGRREPSIHVYRSVRLTGLLQKLVATNTRRHALSLFSQPDRFHLTPKFEGFVLFGAIPLNGHRRTFPFEEGGSATWRPHHR
jgi:hypothetical protein